MTDDTTTLVPALSAPIVEGRNTMWLASADTKLVAPSFDPPFPICKEGILFGANVVPVFGLWLGVDTERLVEHSARIVVHRHRGPDDFVLTIALSGDGERLIVARLPRPATLGAAADAVLALARPPSLWRRIRGEQRFTNRDVLKVACLDLKARDGSGGDIRFVLDGGRAPATPLDPRSLGRGEMYERYFLCNGPFIAVVARKDRHAPTLVAWIEGPS